MKEYEDILNERLQELEQRLTERLTPKQPQKKSKDEVIKESFEKVFRGEK